MALKSRIYAEKLEYYESSTAERMFTSASFKYVDDFVGAGKVVVPAAGSAESGMDWVKKIVGAAPPTVAGVADYACGAVACTLTSTSEKQDAVLYHNDQRNFLLTRGLVWEAWVNVNVIPTGTAESVWGMCGDWTDGPDAITYSAFFTADGSGEIICEMDDNATDRSTTSGITVTADTWHLYRIDFTDITSVKFYIDGANVATSTTFAYAATGANATLQPYFSCYKASGTDVGTLYLDKVNIWGNRS